MDDRGVILLLQTSANALGDRTVWGQTDQMDGHETPEDVTLAKAKAHLSELVERAAQGEPVRITRRGKAMARLVGVEREVKPIDLEALRALTASMPMQPEPARSWLRSIRDEQRY
jgi:prevent-host-death family protein